MAVEQSDVVIIGGGIAGSATAVVLARLNLQVSLIEREPVFRDRVRGEGIHPWGMNEATALDLTSIIAASDGLPLPEWRSWENGELLNASNWADVTLDGAVETSLVHVTMQNRMLAAAEAHGVRVLRPARPVRARFESGMHVVTIDADGREQTLAAPVLIAADGARSWVRTVFGIARHQDPMHHWLAGLAITNHHLDPIATHAVAIEGGRSFIFPQQHGLARAYFVLRKGTVAAIRADRSGRAAILLAAPNLPAGVLADATAAGPLGIFSNSDTWPETHAVPGLLLLGDAVGSNDPSQGQGLSLVMRDIRELRDTILASGGLKASDLPTLEARYRAYRQTLRTVGHWASRLWMTTGPAADARRARFLEARESDPDAAGFGMIFSRGPRDLVADRAAEHRFFTGQDA